MPIVWIVTTRAAFHWRAAARIFFVSSGLPAGVVGGVEIAGQETLGKAKNVDALGSRLLESDENLVDVGRIIPGRAPELAVTDLEFHSRASP